MNEFLDLNGLKSYHAKLSASGLRTIAGEYVGSNSRTASLVFPSAPKFLIIISSYSSSYPPEILVYIDKILNSSSDGWGTALANTYGKLKWTLTNSDDGSVTLTRSTDVTGSNGYYVCLNYSSLRYWYFALL